MTSTLQTWADQQLAAEDAASSLPVFGSQGAAVYVLECQPGGMMDTEPPAGNFGDGAMRSQRYGEEPLAEVQDRQLGLPQTIAYVGGGEVNGRGVFAGVRTLPYSITHIGGPDWMLQGGDMTWTEIQGGETLVEKTYTIPTQIISVDLKRTTLIGFDVAYRKTNGGDWSIDFRLGLRTLDEAKDKVETGPVAGLLWSGESYSPVGESFVPWIALTTQPDQAFWEVSVGTPPAFYLNSNGGFPWWS